MGSQCRLLIVDDDPGMIRALKHELAGQPYEIVTASSADEALPMMEQLKPEVVVSDFQMPGMPGTRLLMHASTIIPHGGRILITGSPSLGMAMDAINLGAVSRLFIKPFSPALLIRAIGSEMARIETARLTDRLLAKCHEPAATGAAHADDYRPHDAQEILRRLRRAADSAG
jgi:DNA-binding NtrC family response regulator